MNDKTKRRGLGLSLALFLFSIYLFAYRGGFHSVDEVSIFAVTESLVKFGQVNTNQIAWTQWTTSQAEAQGFFGPDGNVYSKKGLAPSLAQAPLYWLALVTPGLGMLQTVSLLNAFVTAATGLLVLMFLDRLGFSQATSLLTALIFGLGTIACVYAKYLFSEPLAGFLLLLAAYMLFTLRQEGGLRHGAIAGLAAGFAVMTRANNLFLLPVFGLYLLWTLLDSHRQKSVPKSQPPNFHPPQPSNLPSSHPSIPSTSLRTSLPSFLLPLLTFTAALALPGLILLAYNAARSGHPLQTGYDLSLFSSNLLLGLYKLLFSPLRGLFIYTPILLLSLLGWWLLRRKHPAESWLFVGIVGVTVVLFSAWSSGEGLSWGSRFLVPVVPILTLCLAPIVEDYVLDLKHDLQRSTRIGIRFTFLILLSLSLFIQFLGVAINPWIYLSQLQADFGGEFFLENTAALYDFRYSQIAGQFRNFAVENSDLAWWQTWGFDVLPFGLGLALVILSARRLSPHPTLRLLSSTPLLSLLTLIVTYIILARYYETDMQFGPADDAYINALETAAEGAPDRPILTVGQYHYHIPMNRFKVRAPLIGFAQQRWPLPDTALPLLSEATRLPSEQWLVTIGFPPAAPDNAAEEWLALNTFKISDTWLPNDVRLVHFTADRPTNRHPVETTFGDIINLNGVILPPTLEPGCPLPVEFHWQALTAPQVNYNIFLQLLKSDGVLIAQQDSPPNGGYSPTTSWTPGQAVMSRHALALPADLPPGDYRLIAGLYDPTTGRRLVTSSGTDIVELGRLAVRSNRLSVISSSKKLEPELPTFGSQGATK